MAVLFYSGPILALPTNEKFLDRDGQIDLVWPAKHLDIPYCI